MKQIRSYIKPWRKWPYWARGAAIAVALCLVFFVFQSYIVPSFFYDACGDAFCISPQAKSIQDIFVYSTYPVWASLVGPYVLEHQWALALASLAYYFLIGSFLGLLYGKMRHGKDTIHPPAAIEKL